MEGVCACHAPFQGEDCLKTNVLAMESVGEQANTSQTLMDSLNVLEEALNLAPPKKTEADSEGIPMTAHWMQPDSFVQAANVPQNFAELQEADATRPDALTPEPKPAASDDDAEDVWHEAAVPPAMPVTPKQSSSPRGTSLLALLSAQARQVHTAASETHAPVWRERRMEATGQEKESYHAHKLPGPLASLLTASRKSSLANPVQELSESSMDQDLDKLLADAGVSA